MHRWTYIYTYIYTYKKINIYTREKKKTGDKEERGDHRFNPLRNYPVAKAHRIPVGKIRKKGKKRKKRKSKKV